MTILPTDIRILFTNYDIIAYFLNLAFCSEHFISIEHRRGNQEWTIRQMAKCFIATYEIFTMDCYVDTTGCSVPDTVSSAGWNTIHKTGTFIYIKFGC
jgi:hypothetical protein